MSLSISKSNISGFPSVTQDHLDGITDPLELMFYAPSSFEGNSISVDFAFTYDFSNETNTYTPVNPSSISYQQPSESYGVVLTTTGSNGVRISGTSTNVFAGSFYQFLMRDLTLKVLPPNTSEDYFYFVKYEMPSQTFVLKTYPITLTFNAPMGSGLSNVTTVAELKQYIYWSFSGAATSVINLVESRP